MNGPEQDHLLARVAWKTLQRLLRVFPVVVIMGARQTGKSTLARMLDGRQREYLTLDDLDVLDQAQADPRGLLQRAHTLTIDEVQRAPELLLEIKRAVDEGPRTPGRFVLTGSANLLLHSRVSESLAGRAGYLTLWPLTLGEREGRGEAGMWECFFDQPADEWVESIEASGHPRKDWVQETRIGGYPVPAHELEDPADRALWFTGYAQTYLQRDLQQLAAIDQLTDFRRLMAMASLRVGGLLNQSELARDAALSQATAHRYLNLLDVSFQTVRLPAYAGNRTKRLVKAPKLYWSDPGLGLHLSGLPNPGGAHLENLIVSDLLGWGSGQAQPPNIMHWRTYSGTEVDVVVEVGGETLALEIKATARPRFSDTRGLRAFIDATGESCRGGLLLHGGSETTRLGERVVAAPWWKVV